MAVNLSIKNVPDDIARGLRERAARTAQRRRFLEREIWADIPDELLDTPHDDALDDEIL